MISSGCELPAVSPPSSGPMFMTSGTGMQRILEAIVTAYAVETDGP